MLEAAGAHLLLLAGSVVAGLGFVAPGLNV